MNLSTFYRVWSLDHLSATQPANEACSEVAPFKIIQESWILDSIL